MSESHDTEEAELSALWAAARHALAFFIALFGGAVAIASARLLTRTRQIEMAAWLRPIEHLLRRLLALEAFGLEVSTSTRKGAGSARRKMRALDLQQAATWPASFRIGPARAMARSLARAPARGSETGVCGSFGIAARLEAALRVVDAPLAYARRLAGRLKRMPGLARALCNNPRGGTRTACGFAVARASAQVRARFAGDTDWADTEWAEAQWLDTS